MVERTALLARLETSAPLVVLEALPGAGKLTVLQQWSLRAPGRVLVEGRSLIRTRADALAQTQWAVQETARREGHPMPRAGLEPRNVLTDEELIDGLLTLLGATPWVTAIAFDGIVNASPTALARGVAAALAHRPDMRVLFSTVDATRMLAAADEISLPVVVIPDAEVWFGFGEIERIARTALPGIDLAAIQSLYRATAGHPGVTSALLEAVPQRVLAADVTPADAALYREAWSLLGEQSEQTPLRDVLRRLSPSPRFSANLARRVTGNDDVELVLRRLVSTGVLTTPHHDRCHATTYRWVAGLGRRLDERVREIEDPVDDIARREQLVEAALAERDPALAAALLVGLRRFAEAESLARDWFWEIAADDDADLWRSLLLQPHDRIAPYSALLSLATVLSRRRAISSEAEDRMRELGLRNRLTTVARLSGAALVNELTQIAFGALECADLVTARDACDRWLAEALDVPCAHEVTPSLASAGLLMVPMLAELGRYDDARLLIDHLLNHLDGDDEARRLADPTGSRRVDLLRARTAFAVLAGLPYDRLAGDAMGPPDAGPFPLDWMMRAWTRAFVALDAGDTATAFRHTKAAMDSARQPERWPALVLLHAQVSSAVGEPAELVRLGQLVRSHAWLRRHRAHPTSLAATAVSFIEATGSGLHDASSEPWCSYVEAEVRGLGRTDPRLDWPRPSDHMFLVLAVAAIAQDDVDGATAALLRAAHLRAQDPRSPMLAPLGLIGTRSDLVERLLQVAEQVLPPAEVARLARARTFAGAHGALPHALELSERETTLLTRIGAGLTNAQIAAELFVSVNTVKFHRANLYRKLQVRTSGQALQVARTLGLLPEPGLAGGALAG